MAQAPTIPVRTKEDRHRDAGEVIQLAYDTSVIVTTGLPAIEDVEIRPCRLEFVRPGKHPSLYEIRYIKNLQHSFYRLLSPARKERRPYSWGVQKRLAGETVEELHPDAGKIIRRVSPLRLHRVPVGSRVFFLQNGVWDSGVVQEYEDHYEARKIVEKVKKKAKDKVRRYLRLPTIWDRLNED